MCIAYGPMDGWKNNRKLYKCMHILSSSFFVVYASVKYTRSREWIEFHEKLHLNHINQNKMDFKEWITDGPYFGMYYFTV